jgi:integrase
MWGDKPLTALHPRDVELWLSSLNLSPKTRNHIRNMLHMLVDYAMWAGVLAVARNPLDLVRAQGATKRMRKPRTLTAEEFSKLCDQLENPFRLMAQMSLCLGLRFSARR